MKKKLRKYLLCATWDTDSEGDPLVLYGETPKSRCGSIFYDGHDLEEFNYAEFWEDPSKLEKYLYSSYYGTESLRKKMIKKIRGAYPKGERPRVFLWGENAVRKLITEKIS